MQYKELATGTLYQVLHFRGYLRFVIFKKGDGAFHKCVGFKNDAPAWEKRHCRQLGRQIERESIHEEVYDTTEVGVVKDMKGVILFAEVASPP